MLNRPEEYQRMAHAESRLWWYRSLHHLVAHALSTHGVSHEARVLDAGCGTGGLMLFLQGRGYSAVSGFDISSEAVAICRDRNLPVQTGDLRHIDQLYLPASHEVIVSNDTLYFFSATELGEIIQYFVRALVPGGLLILNVPALRAFRGIHDVSVGIGHRFSRNEIKTLLASAGLLIRSIRYWPFFVSPIVYAKRFAQRVRLDGGRFAEVRSDIDVPHPVVNRALEIITRFENTVLPWKPFGSSLFVIAQKPL